MTGDRIHKVGIAPWLDFVLVSVFAYYSPAIVNLIAPLVDWNLIDEEYNIIWHSPFLAGVALVSVPFILRLVGFYHRHNVQRIGTALRQLLAFSVYYLCAIAVYNTLRNHDMTFNHTLVVNMVGVPVVLFLRFLLLRLIKMHTGLGHNRLRQVILAGTEEDIEKGWNAMPAYWRASMNVVGRVITGQAGEKEIQDIIEKNSVTHLFLFGEFGMYHANETVVHLCEVQGIDIYMWLNEMSHTVNLRAEITEVGANRLLLLSSVPEYSWARLVKDLMDKLMALLLLICSSPLWLVAAIGIKISDPKGKIFYRQQRSGLYGRPFGMWKFRSMYSDADKRLEEVKAKYGNEMSGPIFKLTNDPRIFPFGHFIRKFSIDELPQLLNILMGDMSIVGPRPLPVYETAEFPSIAHRRRLSVKPGLTCYWQVEGRSDSGDFDNMINKDLKYIDNWSLWLDVVLFFRTIPAVLFGKGAK